MTYLVFDELTSILMAACFGDNNNMHTGDVTENKDGKWDISQEEYDKFKELSCSYELLVCGPDGEASDEWQPMQTVILQKSTGNMYRMGWLKFCSYHHLPPKIGLEWTQVVRKETVSYYYINKDEA